MTADLAIVNGKAEVPVPIWDALRLHISLDRIHVTEGAGDATQLARCCRTERLWVLGGDGTIHEVVAGLMARERSARPSVGFLPFGTANDLCRHLELIPVDVPSWLERADLSASLAMDVGWAGDRAFANQLTIGVPARITQDTPQPLKDSLGGLAYALHGLRKVGSLRAFRVVVEAGDLAYDGDALMVSVGNGTFGGGGVPIHPDAQVDDGALDVIVVPPVSTESLLSPEPPLLRARVTSAHLRLPDGEAANLDGEPMQAEDLDIAVAPAALNVLRPPRG